jgi:hypothetical protein
MSRIAVLSFTTLLCACTAAGGTLPPGTTAPQRHDRSLAWFGVASYLRNCHGRTSSRGALWASMAASIGALHYLRNVDRSTTSDEAVRRRVSSLMDRGYQGNYGDYRPRASCKRTTTALAAYYRRLNRRTKDLVVRLAATLLKKDRPGRMVLARSHARRHATRRGYASPARRFRRATLKPSEQQLPIGK